MARTQFEIELVSVVWYDIHTIQGAFRKGVAMSEKRKDNKGRILKTGESQRPNGTYAYRYKDIHKKEQWVYAATLKDLREKEQAI